MAGVIGHLVHAIVQRLGFCVVVGMGRVHGFMHMIRLDCGLRLLMMMKLAGRHLRSHRVTHPTAQRQQGDQEGEQKMAHG